MGRETRAMPPEALSANTLVALGLPVVDRGGLEAL